jgi:hypothetical protein
MAICTFNRAKPLRRTLSFLRRLGHRMIWTGGFVIVNNNLTDYSPHCRLRCRSLLKESMKLADAEFGRYSNVLVFTAGHNQTV